MNPIAQSLNQIIESGNPHLMEMLSDMGKNLFFPKGILSQSAEAKEKAYKLNATIGIATEKGQNHVFPFCDGFHLQHPAQSIDNLCTILWHSSATKGLAGFLIYEKSFAFR